MVKKKSKGTECRPSRLYAADVDIANKIVAMRNKTAIQRWTIASFFHELITRYKCPECGAEGIVSRCRCKKEEQ